MNQRPYQNFGITKQLNSLVDSLASNHNVIVNILGNPYCLNKFEGAHKAKAILVSYEEEALAQGYKRADDFWRFADKREVASFD